MTGDLLAASGPEWERAEPASAQALELLKAAFELLPDAYLTLLSQTNGGEGALGVAPGWFQLWPAEQVPELNSAYHIPEFLPGWIGIGSNGGGELLALDRPGRVQMIPFVPMDANDAVCIAEDIQALARQFGRRDDAT